MESNSDKQLRDKLTGAEFPFDPAAWDSMEAMLDKKKKRRGFFWWWTGGIAAALLLGVAGYEVGRVTTDERPQSAEISDLRHQKSDGIGEEGHGAITKSEEIGNATEATEGVPQTTVNAGAGDNQQLTIAENSGNRTQKSENTIGKNEKQQQAKNGRRETGNSQQVAQNKKPGKQKSSSASDAKPGDGFVAFNGAGAGKKKTSKRESANASKQQPVTVVQQEAQMLSGAGAAATIEQPANLQRMEASLLSYVSEDAIAGLDKKEEDVLPKMKKRVFNYSLGVLANVTGTTLGKQEATSNSPSRPTMFYNRPSYMVGFTHDFLFVNRVAITNSILYSQTSFEVLKPKSENYPVTLTYYSSRISELTIPIGIKVYPVVKQNFKFYINTGIINHIKLKETFDYKVMIDTLTNANLGMQPDQFFPTSNSFDPNTKAHDVYSGVTNTETTTDDFSINKSKRYYASFYAGAGVEYIAKKRVVLFCEPMFYMNLQKIGVQDKRKYNFGVSGGLRYQF